jgi:hypothetical protein
MPDGGHPIATGAVTFQRLAAREERMHMLIKLIIGAAVGGGLGFAYYKFIGCSTGACPLTSNPWISSIYGALLGALIATSVR